MNGFDTRGVSTTVGFALTLGITTLLVTGLLVGIGGFVDDQRQRAIESELSVIGQQIAADVQAGDRFVQAGDTEFTIRRDLPNAVVGRTYRVSVVVDDPGNTPPLDTYLRLETSDPDIVAEIDLAVRTDIAESSFTGGSVSVTYDSGELEVAAGA